MARIILAVVLFFPYGQAFSQIDITHKRDFPSATQEKVTFPKSHGAHPQHAIEWWYFTGHLFDENGSKVYGTQFTLFRIGALGRTVTPEAQNHYVAHIGLTDLGRKVFDHVSFGIPYEPSIIDVSQKDLLLKGPGFTVARNADGSIKLEWSTVLPKQNGSVSFSALLKPQTDLILHGQGGVSYKGNCDTCATVYSSYPRLEGNAVLKTPAGEKKLTSKFWYDHEFGSQVLEKGQVGWDWFGISFLDKSYLMLFQLRDTKQKGVFSYGSIGGVNSPRRSLSKSEVKLTPLEYWKSPKTGSRYPIKWAVFHPHKGEIIIESELKDQEVVASYLGFPDYYEGNCRVIKDGKVIGHAYLEMNGYGGASSIPNF